jgi:hypothetical protein
MVLQLLIPHPVLYDVGRHVKCMLLFNFNEICKLSTNFSKIEAS